MQLAQNISSLILSLRKKVNIKVRQPLQKALIPSVEANFSEKIKSIEDIIKTETNIKELQILEDENFIRKKAKANFKTLGKKLGAKMKWAAEEIQQLKNSDIEKIQEGIFLLNKDYEQNNEEAIYITVDDIEITTDEIPGFEIASKGLITVALDITLNEGLVMEGQAREFINRLQNIRKDQNLDVTDKIFVKVSENENLKASITQFNKYICAEILAEKLEFASEIVDGISIDVNEATLKVNVTKKED
jgi:isoleucyl-tRNA synthetase